MKFRIVIVFIISFIFTQNLTADTSEEDRKREQNTHWKDRKYSFFFGVESASWKPASVDTSVLLISTRDKNHLLANTPFWKSSSLGVKQSPVLNTSPLTTYRWGFNIEGRLLGTRGSTVHEAFLTSTETKKQFYEGTFYFPEQATGGFTSSSADIGFLLFNSVKAEQTRYIFTRNILFFSEDKKFLKDLGLRVGFSGELNRSYLKSDISVLIADKPDYRYEQSGYTAHLGIGYRFDLKEKHILGISADYIDGISQGKNVGTVSGFTTFGSVHTEFQGRLSGTDFRMFYKFLNLFEDTNLKIGFYRREVTQTVINTETKYKGLMDPLISYYLAYPTTGGVALGYLLSRAADLGPMPKVADRYQGISLELEFKY